MSIRPAFSYTSSTRYFFQIAPKSYQRARFANGAVYNPASYTAYKKAVAQMGKKMMKPLSGPLSVELHFIMPTRRIQDLDNAAKAVFDALNGIAWVDDSQIFELHTTKSKGDTPGFALGISEIANIEDFWK